MKESSFGALSKADIRARLARSSKEENEGPDVDSKRTQLLFSSVKSTAGRDRPASTPQRDTVLTEISTEAATLKRNANNVLLSLPEGRAVSVSPVVPRDDATARSVVTPDASDEPSNGSKVGRLHPTMNQVCPC
jgi:hypothetical protein